MSDDFESNGEVQKLLDPIIEQVMCLLRPLELGEKLEIKMLSEILTKMFESEKGGTFNIEVGKDPDGTPWADIDGPVEDE